jgi:hypothetical protein
VIQSYITRAAFKAVFECVADGFRHLIFAALVKYLPH